MTAAPCDFGGRIELRQGKIDGGMSKAGGGIGDNRAWFRPGDRRHGLAVDLAAQYVLRIGRQAGQTVAVNAIRLRGDDRTGHGIRVDVIGAAGA